jgi:hypothetical protein
MFEHAVQKGSPNSATLMAGKHTDLNNFKDPPRLVKDVRSAVMESGQNISDCRSILFGQPAGLVWSVHARPKHFDDSCMFSRPKHIWKSGDMNVLNDAAQGRQLVHVCESCTSNG